MMRRPKVMRCLLALLVVVTVGCGGNGETGDGASASRGGGRRGGPGRMASGAGGDGGEPAAVPVEATEVVRRTISSYIETNGTLEAENDVDLVARAAGPIVQLEAEETMHVRAGDLLARIEPEETKAQLEISRVALEEARLAYERADRLLADALLSQEAYEDAKAAFDSAQAQFDGNRIQLSYTEIRAPFDGQIVERYVKFAQNVGIGDRLFRLSDFDPLLCPIQVPERNIPQLRRGQRAYLEIEAWPSERFSARVLRISPVVEAATGTVRVTLAVSTRGRLRPGMFASVYLETDTREGALVIPRKALAIESLGDTVYVAGEGRAMRREVELGFREGDYVEILSGLEEGELVVTVGQDGLSDGTPIQVLDATGAGRGGPPGIGEKASALSERGRSAAGSPGNGDASGGRRLDLSRMTPEQVEQMKERMRARGMTDDQIEQRLRKARQSAAPASDDPGDG